ncbi:MAG: sialate O-acetylesterase [Planctomycetota bacterium]|nr:MAG: sialate O-acetylesterase [Planctomycetota bacterium]
MKHFVISIVSLVVFLAFFGSQTCADVTLPAMFSDHMVLQRDISVPVWGRAEAGEKVTVEFGDWSGFNLADSNGEWMVTLPPMDASWEPGVVTVTAGDAAAVTNAVQIDDVLVGEVWVCSGQSNMLWELSRVDDANEAIADSGNYGMRLFVEPEASGPEDATWEICDPNTSPDSSAVAFFFGRELARELNVPVGLIQAPKGASGIKHWTSTCDGILYVKKIVPLQPYAISGVIWYQGEWDTQTECTAQRYYERFPALIQEWRNDWGQGDFPFLYVQLPCYDPWIEPRTRIPGWMIVRDAQLATLSVQNTAMACLIDLPAEGLHPKNKEPVGYRLALGARALACNEDIVYSGPIFDLNKFYIDADASAAVIGFDHIADGLHMVGDELTGFEIAGADGNFVDADASIDDESDTVVVWSSSVNEPTTVRYGWHNAPQCNLFNTGDLPASPFRTDELSYRPRHRYIDGEE